MKTAAALALAAATMVKMANAHAMVHAIWVNGVDQGAGRTTNGEKGYIRSPPNNNPVTDVTSKDVTCNVGGDKAGPATVDVAGGDKITIEWHHNTRTAGDDIIDGSHKGPVLTYIAPAESNGAGNVWVKIQEDGFDGSKWGVDRLIANKGKYDVTLPSVPAGEYLLRSELIALHEGNRQGGAQLYMECIQLKVTSGGSSALPAGVAIPGAYTASDPGILFDIYNGAKAYPIPGPKVSTLGAGSDGDVPAPAPPAGDNSTAPAEPAPAPEEPAPAPTTLVTSVAPAPTGGNSGGAIQAYGQCGGQGFSGGSSCVEGFACKAQNEYYSQCVPA